LSQVDALDIAMAATAVLQQFVVHSLKELHHRRGDGTRVLDAIYEACSSSGLVKKAATDVRSRYERVFDAALESLMGCWIIDYVEEVCGDRHLTSNDPVDAQLLDGQFVKEWCQSTLQHMESELVTTLKNEQLFQQFQTRELQKQIGKANVLVDVLHALARIRNTGGAYAASCAAGTLDRQGVDAELQQALLLQQCFKVMEWCAWHRLHDKPHTGRYASMPEWVRRVQVRRDRRPMGKTLFLDDTLKALMISGAYPFSTLQNMIYMIFLTIRDIDTSTWHNKLALFLYYLTDLDYLPPGQKGLDDFRATFSLPAPKVVSWYCMFLLDCAESAPGSEAAPAPAAASASAPLDVHLDQACQLLACSAQPDMPFKFIETLMDLGRADVALALHRAQAGGGLGELPAADSPQALLQARTLVELRLRCGLLTEAFLTLRSLCSQAPAGPQRTALTSALVSHLAEWAMTGPGRNPARASALCELPWSDEEERALVSWLVTQMEQGRPAADYLPLYFLQRGRMMEAMGAFNRWQVAMQAHGRDVLPGAANSTVTMLDAMINAAAGLLPTPQRNVGIPVETATASRAEGGVVLGTAAAVLARGPAMLLQGLGLQADNNMPVMQAVFQGDEVPPFLTGRWPASSAPVSQSTKASPSEETAAPQGTLQQSTAGALPLVPFMSSEGLGLGSASGFSLSGMPLLQGASAGPMMQAAGPGGGAERGVREEMAVPGPPTARTLFSLGGPVLSGSFGGAQPAASGNDGGVFPSNKKYGGPDAREMKRLRPNNWLH